MNKSRMVYWYPKIKSLDIPQPKTEIVLLTEKEKENYYESEGLFSDTLTKRVKKVIIENFRLPIFLRTDEASGKHFWGKTCFVNDISKLKEHISEITSFSRCCDIFGGLPIEAMVVREFIPMDTRFTAFHHDMPVNPERRYFVENGKVVCFHSYWIQEAIEKGTDPKILPENWREIAMAMNLQTQEEIKILTGYAEQVSKVLDGFWSVDFCKAKDGRWILIDLAEGEKSWHPDDCPFNRTPKVDLFKDSKPLTDKDFEII